MDDTIRTVLTREEVESLIKGTHGLHQMKCVALEKEGLMRFSGNQHNESWSWNFDALKETHPTTINLYHFYLGLKAYIKNNG